MELYGISTLFLLLVIGVSFSVSYTLPEMSKNVDIFLSNVLHRRPRNSLYLQMHKLGTKNVNFSVRFTH